MTDTRPTGPFDPDDLDTGLIEEIQALQGEEMPADQDAVLEPDEIETRRKPTRTEMDEGFPIPDPTYVDGSDADIDALSLGELRDGETDDPEVAAQEGYAWVPPSDPPIVPTDDPDGVEVGAGTGTTWTALDEPYDDDHRGTDDSALPELTQRIREALLADATTAVLDGLIVETDGPRVHVRGIVQSVDDADSVVAVIERVDGVTDVIDETELDEG